MSEIAIISLNPAKLKVMEEQGDKQAAILRKMVENPNNFLSTIQIGITLAGFLGSAFAAENFSDYLVVWIYDDLGFKLLSPTTLDALAIIVITIVLAYFTLVFGELVPKRIAMQKQLAVAKFSSKILLIVAKITKPVVNLLSFSTNAILKLCRLNPNASDEEVSEEDIILMADIGEEKGVIQPYESEWIENIFDFNDVYLKEIMNRIVDVALIKADDPKEKIIEIIGRSKNPKIPVYQDNINDIVAYINVKDYLLNILQAKPLPLASLYKKCLYVPQMMKAANLFEQFKSQKIDMAFVVNEYGETIGIVTLEDLLEQIVGNIYDEVNENPRLIQKLQDEVYLVDGSCLINDLEDELDEEFEHPSDVVSVGGMVLSYLQTIPEDGSKFEVVIDNWLCKVLKVEKHQIKLITMEKLADKIAKEDR
ncbi:MAG: hemolysin family protein [Erysipelotrichaceae bacterium]|nr:hemolysin family protein [Erysipelotrichaceae bacterium]